jgi:hypothetical protein
MMWRTAGCCGGSDAEVTQVAIDDRGFTVGIVGLKQVFEQLDMMGRKPEADICDELLAMVKTLSRGAIQSRAPARIRCFLRVQGDQVATRCGKAVFARLLIRAKRIEAEYGDQVEIVYHTGRGDKEWEEYAINNAPALVIGDLVKFVGLAPSKESLVGALREAGLT